MGELTPMMQKYIETKEEYKDCILFYRLGDFYEMFFEDAILVSKELELTLTGKSCGLEERAPMCGVPFHAVDSYLNRLVNKGYKVAICEQVEDPKQAKGLVKREVTRIVSPGTNLDTQYIDEGKNNYLLCVYYSEKGIGLSITDVTTGEFLLTQVEDTRKLADEIIKFEPAEVVCNKALIESGFSFEEFKNKYNLAVFTLRDHLFDDNNSRNCIKEHFKVKSLMGLGIEDFPLGINAAGALLLHLYETQKNSLAHITHVSPFLTSKYMLLDSSTRRNLELTETMREKQKRGSLLWVLDKTKTAMGSRSLRASIEQPLIDIDEVEKRLDCVEILVNNGIEREELREYLNPVYDLERLLGKVSYKSANPRDLLAFMRSLSMLPHIKTVLSELMDCEMIKEIQNNLDPLEDICKLIESALDEEPPMTIKEGGIIRPGFSEDVDMLREARTKGKTWLSNLEEEERQKTGIRNLKVKYNKVFGYYLEVTNSFLDQVPEEYVRKQTLTNAERYTTPKLKELEDTILNAEDKLNTLEYDLFCEIRDAIYLEIERVQKTAKAIATLDVFVSLAVVAEQNRYVRPKLNDKGIIDIKDGRHPVVELMNKEGFVCNDTYLDNDSDNVAIITGPNMAGKSTYMRQSALIVLMAQVGSFVPASSANIGLVDRIFTRVGASDDLSSGQSTFMVEMNEVANILRNATKDSLLILDEIGRGTSTYDGLSIAWAVIEHVANKRILGAKTLFATHYHELTELEGKMNNVKNYCIAVKEEGDDIVFLRKIVEGGADKSFGIQVAKLAGVPDMVIDRAKEIAKDLSDNDMLDKIRNIEADVSEPVKAKKAKKEKPDDGQLSFAITTTDEDILQELKEADISHMTPLDAMNTLYRLQNKLVNRW